MPWRSSPRARRRSRSARRCGTTSSLIGGGSQAKIIPDSLTLDVAEFPEDQVDDNARVVTTQPTTGPGKLNMVSATVVHGFQRMVDRGLALIGKINRDVVDLKGTTLAGTFRVAGKDVPYKADFAAFDINGDGTAEGSGQTDVFPVAIRLWVDPAGDGNYKRLMCAVIDNKQTIHHFGAGTLYLQPGVVLANVSPDYAIFATWDRTDQTHGWNEAYTSGTLYPNYKIDSAHIRVDVEALTDNTIQKTVKDTGTLVQNRFNITAFQYAGRTIEGSGAFLVNADAPGSSLPSITDGCFSFANNSQADGQCGALDPTGLDFLSAPTGAETTWPAAFPETPTF